MAKTKALIAKTNAFDNHILNNPVNCPFCEEFEKGYLEIDCKEEINKINNISLDGKSINLNGTVINLGNRILFESDNFVVFPSLGQIVEGLLLIVSKEHYIAIGEVPPALHQELEFVQEKVRTILTETYSTPLFFEHGAVSSTLKGGCCIEHAHIQAFPVNIDILNTNISLLEELSSRFEYKSITSYSALNEQFQIGRPYFFYEDNSSRRYIFSVPDVVPSQYIRQLIAKKICKPERWDWRDCLGLEELVRTYERLKDKF